MSCAVTIPFDVTVPVGINPLSILMLVEGIRQANCAIREWQQIKNHAGEKHQVDFIIESSQGDHIGVRVNKERKLEFLIPDEENQRALETVNKIKQVYSRLKVLDEVKKKGYQKVKEEKLPDGSVRLVLQKWQ